MTAFARTRAWLAHLYTAMGLVCAAGIAVMIVRGDEESLRVTFLLMIAATAIDATDGWLARRARVHEVLPGFSGRALDDLIDFHTYTSLPLLLIWRADILPGASAWLLLLPLLASAYGFSQVNAKTDDGFFLGFPSYWNVAAFYLFMLRPPAWIAVPFMLTLVVLTFVPTVYIYATRGGPFSRLVNVGAALYVLAIAWMLWTKPPGERLLVELSLVYPLTYLALSLLVTLRRRTAANRTFEQG